MTIKKTDWSTERSALKIVRKKVFIEEQRIPEDEEWDSLDSSAVHILAQRRNQPIGCARITHSNKIGRLAVLPEFRKQHYATGILKEAESHILANNNKLAELDAQAAAYLFYFRNGYKPTGYYYYDVGIPHLRMEKTLGGHPRESKEFIFGEDSKIVKTQDEKEAQPAASCWIQIATKQAKQHIEVYLADTEHQTLKDSTTLSILMAFIHQSRFTKIDIYSPDQFGSILHPLNRYIKNSGGRIKLHKTESKATPQKSHIIFDKTAYVRFNKTEAECCFKADMMFLRRLQNLHASKLQIA